MSQTEAPVENQLGTAPISRLILKFGVPSVISLLVNSLYNIVDQIFIGWGVGYLGNAATNVIFPLTVIALAFALLIGDGAASYYSLKLGENDRKAAQKGVSTAVTLLCGAGILITVLFLIFLEPLAWFFGATEANLSYALDYGWIIMLGLPFTIVGTGLNSCIRADGRPQVAMLSMILGAVINTILDPVFIFVFHWGVTGAAIATILGQIMSFLVCIFFLPRFKQIKVTLKDMKPDFHTAKTLVSYGASSFITQIAATTCILVGNNMLVKYGSISQYGADIPLAALGIVMKVNQIMASFIIGIGIGAQPIIGFNYGAGNLNRVKKTYGIAVISATIVAMVGFVLFQFFPQSIINLFGSEEGLYNAFAQNCFRTFLMLCLLTGFQIVTGIFFQAIGKPLKAAIITMSRQILVMVPAMLIIPYYMGVEGVLWSGPVADGLSFLIALILFVTERKHLREENSPASLCNAP